MVELDKPVTMANYVFILLSTMMTSIAFNHVILRGLVVEDTDIREDKDKDKDEVTPNETIQNLYNLKIGLETKVSELQSLIEEYNKATETDVQDKINKLEIKVKIDAKYIEYKTKLSAYKTEAGENFKKIFKFKFDDTEYPLENGYECDTDSKEFFVNKVETLYQLIPNNEGVNDQTVDDFTNTSFEGFAEGKYELTDDGEFKDTTYTKQITNGSIAVYIFAVLISIAGLFYHTHAYHILGAVINMAIAAMGLHLWTLYHDKKDKLDQLNKSYIQNIILASWILCLLALTIFIFIYVHNDSSF